jgi:hypothetical protein
MAARLPLDRRGRSWDRHLVPALTLRPAPLPWVVALRALPAVVIAVAGGAWLALGVGVAFGVDRTRARGETRRAARLSPAVQARFGGFDVWRRGYATTLDQRVAAVEVDNHRIRHTLVARDRTPCGSTVEQRFAVTWTIAGGRTAALHAVKVAGQDPAAAC